MLKTFETVLIISGAISIVLASPMKDETLKPHFNGFEIASQEEINRVDAEEGIESNLIFDGIVVKRRVNRHLARKDDDIVAADRKFFLEKMPYFDKLAKTFKTDAKKIAGKAIKKVADHVIKHHLDPHKPAPPPAPEHHDHHHHHHHRIFKHAKDVLKDVAHAATHDAKKSILDALAMRKMSPNRIAHPDGTEKYTWQTYIKFYMTSSLQSYSACSGIAICPRAVLTAGHCLEGRAVHLTRVYLSPSNICQLDVEPVLASEFASLYTLNNNQVTSHDAHDIGLIKLSSEITSYYNVLNVPPPPYGMSKGLGYGITGNATDNEQACESHFYQFGQSGCNDWVNPGQWICATNNGTNGGICNGDDGGPLVISNPDNPQSPDIPVGVASFYYGPVGGTCFTQAGSVFSSISYYAPLIKSTLKDNFKVCKTII